MTDRFAKYKKYITATLLFSVAVSGIVYAVFFTGEKSAKGSDFLSFYVGGKLLNEKGGAFLYDFDAQKRLQDNVTYLPEEPLLPFRNPPFMAALYSILARLPFITAYKTAVLINIFLIFLTAHIVSKTMPFVGKKIFFYVSPFLFMPNIVSVVNGQLTLAIALVFYLSYLLTKNNRNFISGIVTGLLWMKPQFLLFIVFIAIISKNRNRFIVGFSLTTLILCLVSLLIVGWEVFFDYPEFILASESMEFGSRDRQMISVQSLFSIIPGRFFRLPQVAFFANAVLAVLLSLELFWQKSKLTFEMLFAVVLIFTLVTAYHVLVHDLSILTPALYLLFFGTASTKRDRVVVFIGALTLFFIVILPIFNLSFISYLLLLSAGLYLLSAKNFNLKPGKYS